MNLQAVAAFGAMGISIIPSFWYILSVIRKETKPHIFSWIIWAVIATIIAGIQWGSGAGIGAWPTFFGAVTCLIIAILSFRHGEKKIAKSDWGFLILAVLALPMWLGADNPTLAACWLILIDQMGFYPTLRKAWYDPWKENLFAFFAWALAAGLSVVAVESYSVATALYPAIVTAANLAISVMLFFRRRCIAKG